VTLDKRERFKIFVQRLMEARRAISAEDALMLLSTTLNAVEDEFTDILFDPSQWMSDGRMYPPQADSARDAPGRPDVTRYRSKAHNTFIAKNGAIRIEDLTGSLVVLSKPGNNGKEV